MQPVDVAQRTILQSTPALTAETVFLAAAAGRVVADDVKSRRNLPPRDNSAMDGYGLMSSDIVKAGPDHPVPLSVVGRVLAGDNVEGRAPLTPGQAVRIMTGAQIPPGVDCVVMRENTDEAGVEEATGTVQIHKAEPPGCAIRRRGEDVTAGTVVVRAGEVMTPARINLVAQAGHATVRVKRRPVVAILASGDELLEVGQPASDDDIVNSNAHALAAMVREAGGEPHLVGIAQDTLEDHVAKIDGAQAADVLLTIGGVSMGTHDFVRPAFEQLGVELSFWKVAMRPGKPLAFGRRGHQMVFGLPGNPVSSQVSFELFVRPALRRMLGRADVIRRPVRAQLVAGNKKKRPGVAFYARAQASLRPAGFEVRLDDKQSSGQISGLARSNALVVIGADQAGVATGDEVDVLLLDDSVFFGEVES